MGKVSTFFSGLLSVALLGGFCYCGFNVYSNLNSLSDDTTLGYSDSEDGSTTETTESRVLFRNVQVNNRYDLYAGSLACVNADNYTDYDLDSVEFCNVFENRVETYSVSNIDMELSTSIITEINSMVSDFNQDTENTDTMIRLGYISPDELTDTTQCDHVTGLSFDLSSYDGNIIEDFDGTGDFSWIAERADKYGFIQRYPSDKADITGIDEPSHFRYVGLPHSAYMKENNLCLEEYLDLVKNYKYNDPLEITTFNGRTYNVYYVAEDEANASTNIPVLMDMEYSISGNNLDGYIVTVKVSG